MGVTCAVFWPATHCNFLNYDDPEYFPANVHVTGGLTLANIRWAFCTGFADNWHPLTWISLMWDADVFGKGPFGPHFVNVLIHAANTLLLFLVLRQLTSAVWRSAIVAALFALHPLHVESVAWVSERKDVLSAFFGLLALWAYAIYARQAEIFCKSRIYWLSLFLFTLALMSKPMIVTLPFVMLLLDWWPLQRFQVKTFQKCLVEKIPFFALSLISCVVTFVVQQTGGAVISVARLSLSQRIENSFVSYARYMGKTFWPVNLAIPYPLSEHWKLSTVVLSAALVFVMSAAAICFARKFPFAFTGWFWFAGMLVPAIGLVQVGDAAMADRYTYLPLIGLFIVLVWGAGEICADQRASKSLMFFFVMLVLVPCAFWTHDQLNYWHDSERLFRHTLAVTGDNYTADVNLGTALSKRGDYAGAMDLFRDAERLNPSSPEPIYNMGNIFAKRRDWNEAIQDYRFALQISPKRPDILNNLGVALAAKNQLAEAITNYEASLQLKPDYADAHNNLAAALFREGRFDEAVRHFYLALQLEPDNLIFCANLGDALAKVEDVKAAAECYQQVLKLEPDNNAVRKKLQLLDTRSSK